MSKRKPWLQALKYTAGMFLLLVVVGAVGVFAYISVINHRIDDRIEQLHSAKASRFYAFFPPLRVGQRFRYLELKNFLEDQGFNERKDAEDLAPSQYRWEGDRKSPVRTLSLHRPSFSGPGHFIDRGRARLTFEKDNDGWVLKEVFSVDTQTAVELFEGVPKLIGAFLAGRIRTQDPVTLSDIPVSTRLAVIAIEDVRFLEHHGVSFRGTVRALLKNLMALRWVQGGSTITQQLMKNLFFTKKKSIERKFKEALFAFLTEQRYSKEAILEAYLNEVYLGQWGTHEIHGVSEGARYYFNRPLTEITLAQSATLAAILQSPNTHDPHRFPDRAITRRNLVLKKMLEAEFILPPEYELAVAEPLKVAPADRSLADVDYFMDLVMQKLPKEPLRKLEKETVSLYVSLNPSMQVIASQVLTDNLGRLQKNYPSLKRKLARGLVLQGALIAVDIKQCAVLSLQGGTHYKQTQFNRVLQGVRQPGSLFKPFVYLTAFSQSSPSRPFVASTQLEDAPFEWKYDNQRWQPRNYDGKFRGNVTIRQALEDSINIPTARLAQAIGIPPIIDVLRRAGIQSALPSVPSLSLGSADVTPFELAEAFSTLANMGQYCSLRPYFQVFDENRNLIFETKPAFEARLPVGPAFQTVSLLKGVLTQGTAKYAFQSGLNVTGLAGKTGTTNDAKDAWFVGFSPQVLVLVWVGFDEDEKIGLTGAAAALPIWIDFMKKISPFYTIEDFSPPSPLVRYKCLNNEEEYFVPGSELPGCTMHP